MKVTSVVLALFLAGVTPLFSQNQGYADMVEKVQSAVVSIQVTQEAQATAGNPLERELFEFFNRRQPPRRRDEVRGGGTGFVISSDGYIVTNRHVVDNASSIEVTILGDQSYKARLVGIDNSLDVAMIKIDARNLNHVDLGDSSKMRIGDVVLAMGYPLGLGFTVTSGIISGLGRSDGLRVGTLDISEYIQTDADFTFGNSGGPLLNTRGEVIAINTMIVERGETFGFSIPSNLMARSIDQLKNYGQVRRGALGVSITDMTEDAREYHGITHGAQITSVTPGMPAEEAGLKSFDIILSLNGDKVESAKDVIDRVSSMLPGDRVNVEIMSNGKRAKKSFKLGDRASFTEDRPVETVSREEADDEDTTLGFSMLPLDNRLRRQLGLNRSVTGVIVDEVDPDSQAAERGMVRGMLITHVNGEEVESPKEVLAAVDKVRKDKLIALQVQVSTGGNFEGAALTPPRQLYLRKK
ncbi:MAG: trypsin-like peptidase domain-containing protein [Acidobacteriota bacterium]|nr:trypsin-like peptidase domain-containing protein [Acidobacteriota bacterium]